MCYICPSILIQHTITPRIHDFMVNEDELYKFNDMLQMMPGIIALKNKNSEFIGLSKEASSLLGWRKSDEGLGQSDYDIPCEASKFAEVFRQIDNQVLNSKEPILTLDMQPYSTGWKLVLVEKNLMKSSNDEAIGILIKLTDVSKTGLLKYYMDISKLTNQYNDKNPEQSSYVFSQSVKPFKLTRQQENCLFLLLSGKTSKEIASILNISYRTVETHIASIKQTLNCQSKSELIEKSIAKGFSYYIPEDFLPENF